uniref:Uncharacterized protein n=1 Tax=Eimeria tenella TaxID=5802 RepID=H9B916_EIMTE|nr:hypothetical protein [Eimeria tenella]
MGEENSRVSRLSWPNRPLAAAAAAARGRRRPSIRNDGEARLRFFAAVPSGALG